MSGSLEARIERLQEQVRPEPAELVTVVLLHITPVEESAVLRDGFHRVGKYGVATFLGGTEKERQRALKRLRQSGTYDVDPYAWTPSAITEGEVKAISGTMENEAPPDDA